MRAPSGLYRILSSVFCLLILCSACAPRLAPPGLEAVEPEIATEAGQFRTADGLVLPLRAWPPPRGGRPRAVILALHGFNDYSNAFAEPGPYWAAQGIATYAYDQRGFGGAPSRGLWPGSAALTGDLADAARILRQRHPGVPLYLLGDSMGAAVILAAVGEPAAAPAALSADGAILVAPAVWARTTMPLSHRIALWLGARLFPWANVSGRGLDIQASDNIEMLRALGRDPLVIKETRIDAVHGLVDLMDRALAAAPHVDLPALLLYGEKDEVVPPTPILRLWRELPAAARARQRRALYADGWHMLLRDLQAKVVLDDIAHWVDDPRGLLPSGADAHALARLDAASQ